MLWETLDLAFERLLQLEICLVKKILKYRCLDDNRDKSALIIPETRDITFHSVFHKAIVPRILSVSTLEQP